jgi:hypothetical protein
MPPRPIEGLDRITEDYAQRFREAVESGQRAMILPLDTAELEQRYQDLLAYIYLHVNWRYVSGKCTTEQRELWADACDTASGRAHPGHGMKVPRWWRDDYMEER